MHSGSLPLTDTKCNLATCQVKTGGNPVHQEEPLHFSHTSHMGRQPTTSILTFSNPPALTCFAVPITVAATGKSITLVLQLIIWLPLVQTSSSKFWSPLGNRIAATISTKSVYNMHDHLYAHCSIVSSRTPQPQNLMQLPTTSCVVYHCQPEFVMLQRRRPACRCVSRLLAQVFVSVQLVLTNCKRQLRPGNETFVPMLELFRSHLLRLMMF